MAAKTSRSTYRPLTSETWADCEKLFGSRGACGGCWCMAWRRMRPEFEAGKGEGNRKALRKLASSKLPPGILLYEDREAIGWCSVGPREQFVRLAGSRQCVKSGS